MTSKRGAPPFSLQHLFGDLKKKKIELYFFRKKSKSNNMNYYKVND